MTNLKLCSAEVAEYMEDQIVQGCMVRKVATYEVAKNYAADYMSVVNNDKDVKSVTQMGILPMLDGLQVGVICSDVRRGHAIAERHGIVLPPQPPMVAAIVPVMEGCDLQEVPLILDMGVITKDTAEWVVAHEAIHIRQCNSKELSYVPEGIKWNKEGEEVFIDFLKEMEIKSGIASKYIPGLQTELKYIEDEIARKPWELEAYSQFMSMNDFYLLEEEVKLLVQNKRKSLGLPAWYNSKLEELRASK